MPGPQWTASERNVGDAFPLRTDQGEVCAAPLEAERIVGTRTRTGGRGFDKPARRERAVAGLGGPGIIGKATNSTGRDGRCHQAPPIV
jgi:hypothetical protein